VSTQAKNSFLNHARSSRRSRSRKDLRRPTLSLHPARGAVAWSGTIAPGFDVLPLLRALSKLCHWNCRPGLALQGGILANDTTGFGAWRPASRAPAALPLSAHALFSSRLATLRVGAASWGRNNASHLVDEHVLLQGGELLHHGHSFGSFPLSVFLKLWAKRHVKVGGRPCIAMGGDGRHHLDLVELGTQEIGTDAQRVQIGVRCVATRAACLCVCVWGGRAAARVFR
jgi:hypothetical protein